MKLRAFIVYGTYYGSTRDIAAYMGNVLSSKGFSTDVTEARNSQQTDLDDYQLIIIGSGIKAGMWTKNTLQFIEQHESALQSKKAAFFVSCGEALNQARHEWVKRRYLEKVLERYPDIHSAGLGVFGGVFDFEGKHRGIDNPYLVKIKAQLESQGVDTTTPYDFRDFEKIKEWTISLIETTS